MTQLTTTRVQSGLCCLKRRGARYWNLPYSYGPDGHVGLHTLCAAATANGAPQPFSLLGEASQINSSAAGNFGISLLCIGLLSLDPAYLDETPVFSSTGPGCLDRLLIFEKLDTTVCTVPGSLQRSSRPAGGKPPGPLTQAAYLVALYRIPTTP